MNKKKEHTISRRLELKKLKKLVNLYLTENKEKKDLHKKKWEFKVYEHNIKKLKNILAKLNQQCKDSEIEKFVKIQLEIDNREQDEVKSIFQNPGIREATAKLGKEIEEYKIIRYSPSYSVTHDLYWIEDGTIGDQNDIALGRKKPDIYKIYLPKKIKKLKDDTLLYFKNRNDFESSSKILESAIENLEKGNYASGNILIITLIEGLVRMICKEIYSIQNPELNENEIDDYIYSNFSSLESLILNGDFKPDFNITIAEGYLLSEHVISEELDEIETEFIKFKEKTEWFKENIYSELDEILRLTNNIEVEGNKNRIKKKLENIGDKIGPEKGPMDIKDEMKISIKSRLQFLIRSYKEDRNLIIHGKYSDFNKPWKSYIYCSSILKIAKIFKEYF